MLKKFTALIRAQIELIGLLVLIGWIAVVIVGRITAGSFAELGQIGDSFAPLSAAFAGIAALFAWRAYGSQKEELRLAEKTANENKVEATQQRLSAEEARAEIRADAEKQRFESTFFQLLNVFHDVVNSIVLRRDRPEDEVVEFRGREVFKILAGQFRGKFTGFPEGEKNCEIGLDWDAALNWFKPNTRKKRFEFLRDRYQLFFRQKSPHLSHYFRTLYRLLAFIHTSSITNKKLYGKIVRAQLSDHELMFLFYNGLSWMGKKMNQFVYEYALLKHLPSGDGFPSQADQMIYGEPDCQAYESTPDGTPLSMPEIPYEPETVFHLWAEPPGSRSQ